MQYAIDETDRRREKQISYNKKNKIIPKSVISKISDILAELNQSNDNDKGNKSQKIGKTIKQSIEELQLEMENAASNLEFEEAAKIRDEIKKLQQRELGLIAAPKENYKRKFKKK
jgi:excinuclease ABC subunit B